MLKPDSLRRALTDAVTVLKTSPEMLRIFVDNGSIVPVPEQTAKR
ncbi:phage tail protein, partial [Escherichia coli]|nr:phage tail protein [Escherichia coli]